MRRNPAGVLSCLEARCQVAIGRTRRGDRRTPLSFSCVEVPARRLTTRRLSCRRRREVPGPLERPLIRRGEVARHAFEMPFYLWVSNIAEGVGAGKALGRQALARAVAEADRAAGLRRPWQRVVGALDRG